VTSLMRGALDGIHVLSDCGETKICDERIAGVVYEDVWLARCQQGGKRYNTATYALEVPMDHVAGMEVVEAAGNIG